MATTVLKLAQSFVKDAQKASKGGWFSKPEWDLAAQYWDKAATAFKAGRHFEQAADCYSKASAAYVQINTQLKDSAKAIEYYTRASDLFLSHGSSPDKAAELMEKGCQGAIQLHYNALTADVLAVETFRKTTGYLIDQSRLNEAIEVQRRLVAICEQTNNQAELNKCYLGIIIITLAFGDEVEAGKCMNEFVQDDIFMRSREAYVADGLMQAFSAGDEEALQTCIEDQTLVGRLAKRIRIPGARRIAKKQPAPPLPPQANPPAQSQTPGSIPPPTPAAPVAELDDDDDDLL
ncbi:TPR-like protein [Linderina pennispora]|uniref:Gamma-soluble NSF attachment protein n=1 Tax=Linderina pennispora TaxID=61395 RepID=A0A1Y1WJF4_9FUNG|nr:TPR-like protein [Linderina pennispora]ORX73667.1 TPR-like protein [Linderina pennispora]